LLAGNSWIYLVGLGLIIVVFAVVLVRLWRVSDNRPPSRDLEDTLVKPRAAD
jgi:tellurite resistance protein TehA-like permease